MPRLMLKTPLVVVCFTLLFANVAAAQDWPQWRGANRDAKASGFTAPANWPKELTKKWTVTVGDGVATPALVGNKLYVFAREDNNEIIRCLDSSTGKEAWQKSYAAVRTQGGAGGFPGPRSSPTVSDGKVVTFGVDGMLCCFDAASGKELWRNDKYVGSYPMFYTSSSPIVVNGLCIVQQGGRRDGGVIAYDLSTGDERWKWMESGPAYGSPVLMDVDGIAAVFIPTDSKMVAFNAADGKLLWEIPYAQGGRYNAATPIVTGTTLIIAGPGTGMTAFGIKKDGDKLVEEKLWSNTDNSVVFNTPVLKGNLVFGLSSANQLFCFDTASKKTVWSAPFAKAAAGPEDSEKKAAQHRPDRVPATFVQFVQQDEQEKDQPRDRPRGDRDGRPGEGRGRFGPGGPGGFGGRGPGRGFGGGMGGGRGYGSIVDVGPALLGLTPAGEIVVYKPSAESFAEIARYKVASEATYAYPVPSESGIYIKDKDSVTLWTVD